MKNFSLDDLSNICNPSIERVEVPEWGRWVFVRSISAAERDAFDNRSVKRKRGGAVETNLDNYSARMVALCMCDETGAPMFPDPEKGAVDLGKAGSAAIRRLFDVCFRINGLRQSDVEDAVKNSASEPTSASGSGSQADSAEQASNN